MHVLFERHFTESCSAFEISNIRNSSCTMEQVVRCFVRREPECPAQQQG